MNIITQKLKVFVNAFLDPKQRKVLKDYMRTVEQGREGPLAYCVYKGRIVNCFDYSVDHLSKYRIKIRIGNYVHTIYPTFSDVARTTYPVKINIYNRYYMKENM